MRNPLIKIYMMLEGRNLRLPLTIIFYNAIMSFVMIIFLVFNTETFKEGFYYDNSTYLHQFLIISSMQIGTVFVLMPFYVSSLFINDRQKNMLEQFAMIPGTDRLFVEAKIVLVLMTNGILFLSGAPVAGLACVYTGLGWQKLIRLGFMILLFAFWSGAIAIFFYSTSNRPVWSFAATLATHLAFLIGTIALIEILCNGAVLFNQGTDIPTELSSLCLFLLALNPLSSYLGFYGNITGDNGLILFYCSHFGVDASGSTFSLLFYKCSGIACIITGLIFLGLAIRRMNMEKL